MKYIIIFSIIFIITSLILYFIKKEKRKKKELEEFKKTKVYKEFITEDYENVRIHKQEFINLDLDHNIEREANRLFYDWLATPIIKLPDGQRFKNSLVIISPMYIGAILYEEHKETAKYKDSESIKSAVFAKYNKLKENYIKENPDYLNY